MSFGELALMGMTTRRETVTVEAQGAAVITVELEAYSKCITKSTTTMTVEAKFSLLRECRAPLVSGDGAEQAWGASIYCFIK